MRLEHATAIVAAGNDIGLDMCLKTEYSGRSMYGKLTASVVYSSNNDLLLAVVRAADEMDDTADFMEQLRVLRYDAMGLGLVVY